MLPREGLSASATPCRVRVSAVRASSRDGQVLVTPICSFLFLFSYFSYYVLLFPTPPSFTFWLLSSSLKSILGVLSCPQWAHKCLSKQTLLFYIKSDLKRHLGATSVTRFTQVEPRCTWILPGYELPCLFYISTGTTERFRWVRQVRHESRAKLTTLSSADEFLQ